MRILLISPSYFPVLGGLQSVTRALAGRLLQSGHEVRVITNRFPRTLPASESIDGVSINRWLFLAPRISHIKRGRLDLFLASFFYFPCTLWHLIRFVKAFRPDIVHFHYPESQTIFVRILRWFFNFKLIVTFHAHDIQKFFETSAPSPVALKRLLRAASGVTACSKDLVSKILKMEPALEPKTDWVGTGIDLDRFLDKEKFYHSRPYIFAGGRLDFVKGFDLLIEAFAEIIKEGFDLDLVIAGEGEERGRLEAIINRLQINQRVHLLGRVSPEAVVRLLNGCEFAAAPSRSEQFSVAVLEAMAAGKAVLAARVGALPEFLHEPVNRLVAPGVQGLTEGLRDWCGRLDEIKKRGEENRLEASGRTLDRMVEDYLRVYEKA